MDSAIAESTLARVASTGQNQKIFFSMQYALRQANTYKDSTPKNSWYRREVHGRTVLWTSGTERRRTANVLPSQRKRRFHLFVPGSFMAHREVF